MCSSVKSPELPPPPAAAPPKPLETASELLPSKAKRKRREARSSEGSSLLESLRIPLGMESER